MADIAAPYLALGGVAAIAIGMGTNTRGDSLAGVPGTVASRAAVGWASLSTSVRFMIELHVEPLEKSSRKCLHWGIVSVELCVAN